MMRANPQSALRGLRQKFSATALRILCSKLGSGLFLSNEKNRKGATEFNFQPLRLGVTQGMLEKTSRLDQELPRFLYLRLKQASYLIDFYRSTGGIK